MAGTKKTRGALITWANTNVNANGIQGITGALLNQLFLDLFESIFFGTKAEGRNVAISDAGSDITFTTAFPTGATYKLLIRAYDAAGDEVVCTIDPALQTITGFHIVPATDGILDYLAISLDV